VLVASDSGFSQLLRIFQDYGLNTSEILGLCLNDLGFNSLDCVHFCLPRERAEYLRIVDHLLETLVDIIAKVVRITDPDDPGGASLVELALMTLLDVGGDADDIRASF
jgi:hypothetical protein